MNGLQKILLFLPKPKRHLHRLAGVDMQFSTVELFRWHSSKATMRLRPPKPRNRRSNPNEILRDHATACPTARGIAVRHTSVDVIEEGDGLDDVTALGIGARKDRRLKTGESGDPVGSGFARSGLNADF